MQATNLYEQRQIEKTQSKIETQIAKLISASRGLRGVDSPDYLVSIEVIKARNAVNEVIIQLREALAQLKS